MPRKIPSDPVALRAWRDATLYRLFLRASRAERTHTLQRLVQRGYTDVTITDTALLANLDVEGTTITALARRSGITRQAASQQVAVLEREGYVRREADSIDNRAIRVQRTQRGHGLLESALEIVAALEADYARHLGAARTRELKATLHTLLEHIDPGGGLGPD
jgi:DNA-binding MarR family transcriptional regulator